MDIQAILQNSPLFTPVRDSVSGVISYVLIPADGRQMRQSFYFTNPSLTDDGRYFWFYVFYPPAGDANFGRCLGVADLQEGWAATYPETMFLDASPLIDTKSGEAYWCNKRGLYKRGPRPGDRTECLALMPEEMVHGRPVWRMATHLTFNASRTAVNFDASIGTGEWVAGSIGLQNRTFRVWKRFTRCYNHAQFCPTDDSLMLVAQDYWNDLTDGHCVPYENRLWLLREDGEHWPLFADGSRHGHECWSADGRYVWYVHYGIGFCRVEVATGKHEVVWPVGLWHGHVSANGRWLTGDFQAQKPFQRGDASRVSFYDILTGTEVSIVSRITAVPPEVGAFHMDPHPQFCLQDCCIAYTTVHDGVVCPALTPVGGVISASGLNADR